MEKQLWSSRQRRQNEHVQHYVWNRPRQRLTVLTSPLLRNQSAPTPSLNPCLTIYAVKITTCWPQERLDVFIMIGRHWENVPGSPNSISVDSQVPEQPLDRNEFQSLLPWATPVPGCWSWQTVYLSPSLEAAKERLLSCCQQLRQPLGQLTWWEAANCLPGK